MRKAFLSRKPYQSFGASISRKFLDNSLSVRFSVFDMFFQEVENAESTLGDFHVAYSAKYDSRSLMLTVIWNFSKLKDASMVGGQIDGDEKERIRD